MKPRQTNYAFATCGQCDNGYINCRTCDGTGKGEACFEQGGPVKGLCPDCCGYGYERCPCVKRGLTETRANAAGAWWCFECGRTVAGAKPPNCLCTKGFAVAMTPP